MNRLQGVKESDGVITEYEFDPYGNISKEYTLTASGIKTTRYEYDGNNCLLISYDDKSSTRYTYDKSGNLTNKIYELSGRETKSYYIYDGYNRLSEFVSGDTVAEYTYNSEGLRESKTINGNYTRFIYDGANIVGELTNDNYYLYYRGTELISSKSYDNKNHFYRLDSHGNVTDLVNHLGESKKSYSYTPYGEEKLFGLNPSGEQTILYYWQKETDGTHNPFRYCGEYYDEESGLIYLRNRYYDPSIGRFITEDPIRDGLNWYAYCNNNPVMFVDPTGYYKEGDENLLPEIQLIINGEDGKTGGLTAAYNAAKKRYNEEVDKEEIKNAEDDMKKIGEYAEILRKFNISNINRVMVLINPNLPQDFEGVGHAAVMLINEEDQALLLSSAASQNPIYSTMSLRIATFSNSQEWGDFLYRDGSINAVTSFGYMREEKGYANFSLSITKPNGRTAFGKVAELFANPGKYILGVRDCDYVTASVVRAAGKFYDDKLLPIDSFRSTQLYYTNPVLWSIIND